MNNRDITPKECIDRAVEQFLRLRFGGSSRSQEEIIEGNAWANLAIALMMEEKR